MICSCKDKYWSWLRWMLLGRWHVNLHACGSSLLIASRSFFCRSIVLRMHEVVMMISFFLHFLVERTQVIVVWWTCEAVRMTSLLRLWAIRWCRRGASVRKCKIDRIGANLYWWFNSVQMYSLWAGKRSRLGQQHGLQNIILTPCYYKNIYRKVRYVYFYESIFQDKSIHIIFTFANT